MGRTPKALAKDKIFLLKDGADRLGPFVGAVDSRTGRIEVFVDDLDANTGDKIARPTAPNKEETYEIVDVHYEVPIHRTFPKYILDVKRQGTPEKPSWRGAPTINISNSQGIQIGDYNAQSVVNMLESLAAEIDKVDAPEDQKVEAKSRLQGLLSHPLVVGVLGSAAGGLAGELTNKS